MVNNNKTIFLFNQNLEFCVRDIRSRLSQPDNDIHLTEDEEILIKNKINITNELNCHDLSNNSNSNNNNNNVNINLNEEKKCNKLKMNIFIKEISVTLFTDDCEKLTKKKAILTINLDNLVICYNHCVSSLIQ